MELGGCTLNTLRVFQWLSGENRMATFSGAVGADLEGKNLSRRLKRSGLNCLLDVKTEHRTGKTVSLVTKNGKFQNRLHKLCPRKCGNRNFLSENMNSKYFRKFRNPKFSKKEFSFNFNFLTSFGPPENGIKSQDILEWSRLCRTSTTDRSTLEPTYEY